MLCVVPPLVSFQLVKVNQKESTAQQDKSIYLTLLWEYTIFLIVDTTLKQART